MMKSCYFVLIQKEGFEFLCPFHAYFGSLPVAGHRHVAQLIDSISGDILVFASAPSRPALETKLEMYLEQLGLLLLPAPGSD